MELIYYIEKVLLNVTEIKNIKNAKIERGDVNEKKFQQLIKCWKDNTNYDSYFEELIDYINIESFSDVIIDNMIDNNIGIEKISHIPFKNNILLKLAHVSEDASMLLFKRLYTNNKYSVNELIECFKSNYSDSVYEYLCILNTDDFDKEIIIDYIANKYSNQPYIKDMVFKRARGRTLKFEISDDVLIHYIEENEYVYDLAISENIFASEHVLRKLMNVKGIKYCKEIRKKARETLENKVKMYK